VALNGHCSYRGVTEVLRDCFDYNLSVGTGAEYRKRGDTTPPEDVWAVVAA